MHAYIGNNDYLKVTFFPRLECLVFEHPYVGFKAQDSLGGSLQLKV